MSVRFTGGFIPNMSFSCLTPRRVVWLSDQTIYGLINQTIGDTLVATGDQPITFGLVSGSLPTGITLEPDGSFVGTTTNVGVFNVTIRASSPYLHTDQDFAMEILASPPGPVQIITDGSTLSLSNWTTSSVSLYKGAFDLARYSGRMSQITGKTDDGKHYTFTMSYSNAIVASTGVNLSYTIQDGNKVLATGNITNAGSINSTYTIAHFVGTGNHATLVISNLSGGYDTLVFNISITRDGG